MMPMPTVLIKYDHPIKPDITQAVRNGGKTPVDSKYADEISSVSGFPTTSMLRESIDAGFNVDFISRSGLNPTTADRAVKIIWFENSYKDYGDAGYFVREIIETDESSLSKNIAVFWTKNKVLNPKNSDLQFKKYQALHDLINVRTDVDNKRFYAFGLHDHQSYINMKGKEGAEHMFLTAVTDSLFEFIDKNLDVKEIHVWIQGNTEKVIYSESGSKTIGYSNKVLFSKLKGIADEHLSRGSNELSPMFNFPYPDKRKLKVKAGTEMILDVLSMIQELIAMLSNKPAVILPKSSKLDESITRLDSRHQEWQHFDVIPFQINRFKELKPNSAIIFWNYVLDVDGEGPLFVPTQPKVTIDKGKVSDHLNALLNLDPDVIVKKAINNGLIEEKYKRDIIRLRNIGKFVDGDTIVEWPKAAFFWKNNTYAPFKSRADMLNAHASSFVAYMKSNPNHVILFNGGSDFARKHKDRITSAVVISFNDLDRNIQSRIKSGNLGNQPVDVDESFKASLEYKEILPVLNSFDEIVKPGLYMAASGSGKSTYVNDINAEMMTKHVVNVNVHELVAKAIIDLFSNHITKQMDVGVDENTCVLMHLPFLKRGNSVASIVQEKGDKWPGGLIKGVVIENKYDAEYRISDSADHKTKFHQELRERHGEDLARLLVFANLAGIPRYASITDAVQPGIILVNDNRNANMFVNHHQIGSLHGDLLSNEVVNASYSDILTRQSEYLNDSQILNSSIISTYHFTHLSGSNTLLCADVGEKFGQMAMCVLPNTSISGIVLEKYKSHPHVRKRAGIINEAIEGVCITLQNMYMNDFIHVSNNVKLKSMTIGEIISETDYDTYYVFSGDKFHLLPIVRRNTIKYGKTDAHIIEDMKLTRRSYQGAENAYIATWITPQPGYAGLLAMRYRSVGKIGRRTDHLMLLEELDALDASGHALASFSMEPHTHLAFVEELLTLNPNNPFSFPTNEPVAEENFHTKDEYHAAIKFIWTRYNVKVVSRGTTAMLMKKIIILENVVSFM
jgi:hypothetical protein